MIAHLVIILQFFVMGYAQTGSLISQVLQARNDIPTGQSFAADIVNKRPSLAPSIVLPSPTVLPPSPIVPSPSPSTPSPRSPAVSPIVIGRPVVPPFPSPRRRTPTPDPKVVVVAPQPVIVKKEPAPVRVVKQAHLPVIPTKRTQGLTLVITPHDKCTKLDDILKNNPELSILAKALAVADLEKPKKKENTVFAPTNQAFDKLAKQLNASLEDILKDPNLDSILLYHFVPGKLLKAADLKNNQNLETRLKDQKIQVDKSKKDAVEIKGFASVAKVVKTNIRACDLVIHIIDTVLLPEI